MVAFNLFPSNVRTPFIGVEFAPSLVNAGPAQLPYNALIIGQKLSTGAATADTVVPCTSIADAITAGGRGSMLHRQAIAWFASNQSTALWLGVLADNGAGVAAQGTITVTVTGSAGAGTLALYFGGVLVPVGVAASDPQNTIATNIAAAITAAPDLPITATATTNVVTWTFRHKGEVGNSYDVRANYNGEKLPANVALAFATTTAGTTNPTLTNLIAGMATQWFQILTHPYKDATSLTAIETELLSRAGPLRAIDGVAITSAAGSFSTLTTLGTGRNSGYSAIFAQPGANPLTPPMEFAAETAALIAAAAALDPARPMQTLQYSNALPVAAADEFTAFPQRNLLLFDGIATSKQVGGKVQIDRAITTYQLNPSGQPDTAYLDVTTPLTLLLLRYRFRVFMSRFSRHKLAQDGARFDAGQPVMTPRQAKGEALTWYSDAIRDGLAQDLDAFKAGLDAVINTGDPNRLDFALPVTLMGQLMVIGAQIQFTK